MPTWKADIKWWQRIYILNLKNNFINNSVINNLPLFTQELHPGDFKAAVEFYINELLDPIRKEFDTPEMKALSKAAYSPAKSKFLQSITFWKTILS